MIGAIQTGSVPISPRGSGAEGTARPEIRVEERHRNRPAGETSGDAAVRVPPGGPGGASAVQAQLAAQEHPEKRSEDQEEESSGQADNETAAEPPARTSSALGELSDEERAQVRSLQARDREVRAHEAAHQAVAGGLAGAASFTFQKGPDGRRYAVGGEVPIDAGAVAGDPAATVDKLRTVKRAALAPAKPSSADRRIASSAEAGIRRAQVEKQKQAAEARAELAEDSDVSEGPPDVASAAEASAQGPANDAARPLADSKTSDRSAPVAAGQPQKVRPAGSTVSLLV